MRFEYIYLHAPHSDEKMINQLAGGLEAAGHKVLLSQGAGTGAAQQQRQTEFASERSDVFREVDELEEAFPVAVSLE